MKQKWRSEGKYPNKSLLVTPEVQRVTTQSLWSYCKCMYNNVSPIKNGQKQGDTLLPLLFKFMPLGGFR